MFTPFLLFALLILLTAIIISLVVTWWLLKPIRKSVAWVMPIFGTTPSDRIIALGITTLLCNTAVTALITAPLNFVCDLVSVSASSFAETINAVDLRESNITGDWWRPFASAAQRESRLVSYEFSRAIRSLPRSFPFADIFLALGVWSLIGQGLSNTGAGTSQGKRLALWVRNWDANTRANVGLTILFISGSYMCVAAIVAIPWLAQYRETGLEEQSSLRARLDQALGADSKFSEDFPPNYATKADPAKALRALLEESQLETRKVDEDSEAADKPYQKTSMDSQTKRKLSPERRKQLEDALGELDRQRNTVEQLWKSWLDEGLRRRRSLMSQCLEAFNTNTRAQMTPRERDTYAYELGKWFAHRVDSVDQLMIFAKGEVDRLYNRWRYWAEDVQRDLPQEQWPIRSPDAFSASTSVSDFLRGYSSRNEDTPPFPASDLNLGPFGFFAGWLVRTQSLPLALITGMIGFGIIGAGVSTFVRQSLGRNEAIPVARDIIGIFVRGLSAAVVVFLSVEGGLAVVSTGENEPNAYVLFFTCLVGAVFSERVWLWASGRLADVLPGGDQEDRVDGETSPKGTTEQTAAEEDDKKDTELDTPATK